MAISTPGSGCPSYTQPPQVSLIPYVDSTGIPASSARLRNACSNAAPPISTASKPASALTAAGTSSSRWSCVGTRLT